MIHIGGKGWHKPGKVNGRPGPYTRKNVRRFYLSVFTRAYSRF